MPPPTPLTDPEYLQFAFPSSGRAEWTKYLGRLIANGGLSHVKFGEGAGRVGDETTEQIALGNGGANYSGSISGIPIIFETLSIAAEGKVLTDDGAGTLTGGGSGTINYRTGAWTAIFSANITGGAPINATYRRRGGSAIVRGQDITVGTGSAGPYVATIGCAPVLPGSLTLADTDGQFVTDDGAGTLVGDGSGTVNYTTGVVSVTFTAVVPVGYPVRASWKVAWEPKAPEPVLADLESTLDSRLYTFQKSLVHGVDVVFQGVGTGTVRITPSLLTSEANDVGNGDNPYFSEGALFTAGDVMVCYFTFPGFKKDSSMTFSRDIDLKRRS